MTEEAVVAKKPDASRWLVVAGVMLVAFFASYSFASASQPSLAESQPGTQGYQTQPTGASGDSCACCDTGGGAAVEGATTIEGDVQSIFVDATNGYSPNVVIAQAGIPIEITFSEGYGCMAEVMFPEFGVFEDLTQGGAVVTLPALEAGEYGFSCGMEMVFGTLVVE